MYLSMALEVVNASFLVKFIIWAFFVILIFNSLKVLLLTLTYRMYVDENGIFEEYFPGTKIGYLWQDFQEEEFVYRGKNLKTIRLYFKNKKKALMILPDVYNFDEVTQFIRNKIAEIKK